MNRLRNDFYKQDTTSMAKSLLGKYICKVIKGELCVLEITETEAYLGVDDKACHAYGNLKSERTKPLYMAAGHAYVYLIYGMYYLLNVVGEEEGNPCAVLIREAVPVTGLDVIANLRYKKNYHELSKAQIKNLANGPGKLCRALQITKNENQVDLKSSQVFYLAEGKSDSAVKFTAGKRINIDYAEEDASLLLRFTMEK